MSRPGGSSILEGTNVSKLHFFGGCPSAITSEQLGRSLERDVSGVERMSNRENISGRLGYADAESVLI